MRQVAQRKWHDQQRHHGASTSSSSSSHHHSSSHHGRHHSSSHHHHHHHRGGGGGGSSSSGAGGGEEPWQGYSLDPVICLFETLAEASLPPDTPARAASFYGKSQLTSYDTIASSINEYHRFFRM